MALNSRREECLAKERDALAKIRNIPPESIDIRELDPDERPRPQTVPERVKEKRTWLPFGKLPTAADLADVIRVRNQRTDASEDIIDDDDASSSESCAPE